MADNMIFSVLIVLLVTTFGQACDLMVTIQNGKICGSQRTDEAGNPYASFRGVQYAKQPLGELRFKELQPPEPIRGTFNASTEGPICPQKALLFSTIQNHAEISESCIHANVHVPLAALPGISNNQTSNSTNQTSYSKNQTDPSGLPILVFVHGGSFYCGAGDADFYGPEYLMTKNVIVITFNYRLNVFGFLSLDTPEIPGNQALRDVVTLLRWVQRNAKAFGGDPSNVTLFGQSAGGVMVHLLTLSKAAEDLYSKAIVVSGAAVPGLYTASPTHAQRSINSLLASLKINATDPKEIHQQLCLAPLDDIVNAQWYLDLGIFYYFPVVDSLFPNVTRILDDTPENLMKKGRGNNKPILFGCTNNETYSFELEIEKAQVVSTLEKNNTFLTLPDNFYAKSQDNIPVMVSKIKKEYFGDGNITMDKYLAYSRDSTFKYPVMKSALLRARAGAASTFLYEFSYSADTGIVEAAYNLDYEGAAHLDDIFFVFKVNSRIAEDARKSFPARTRGDHMKEWMTSLYTNFMRCSNPTCISETAEEWPAVTAKCSQDLMYQEISEPKQYHYTNASAQVKQMMKFFTELNKLSK